MSKSVREQINQGIINVEHKSLVQDVELPTWLRNTAPNLDDAEALIDSLRKDGQLLGVLHQGLAQSVINVRAAARRYDAKKQAYISAKHGRDHVAPTLPNPAETRAKKADPVQAIRDVAWAMFQKEPKALTKKQKAELMAQFGL